MDDFFEEGEELGVEGNTTQQTSSISPSHSTLKSETEIKQSDETKKQTEEVITTSTNDRSSQQLLSVEDEYLQLQEIVAKFNSPVELESIGLDKLKEYLGRINLKSGGTLKERAERLFKIKCTPLSSLDKKLFVKAKK